MFGSSTWNLGSRLKDGESRNFAYSVFAMVETISWQRKPFGTIIILHQDNQMQPDLMPETANHSEYRTLSTWMISGLLHHSKILFKLETARTAGKEKLISMIRPSWLKSSSTFTALSLSPSANWSAMKSSFSEALHRLPGSDRQCMI